MAALGGVVACAGAKLWPWLVAPPALACAAVVLGRGRGLTLARLAACLLFLYAGMYVGYTRSSHWRGRSGASGEVFLKGRVEVGNRGEPGDEAFLFRVCEVLEGKMARSGDCYLLKPGRREDALPAWGDTLEVRGNLYLFDRVSGRVGGSLVAGETRVLAHTGNPLLRLAHFFRDTLRRQVANGLEPDTAGLIEGMLLGDYRHLSSRDLVALRATGLIHLCAASGLHVGILLAFIMWLGAKLNLSRRMLIVIQTPLLITYALAVGLTVPVQRAAVVALLAALAFYSGRDFDFLPALGVAAIYLVFKDPSVAREVSFQLSFAAALGVALLHRPLSGLLKAGKSKALSLLAATLAAQLAVGPLLMRHFGEASLTAPLSNLLVLPLVPLMMALSLLSALVGMAGVGLGAVLLKPAALLARCILLIARNLAGVRWAALRFFPFPATWMAIYYPVLAAAFLATGRRRRLARLILAALLAAGLIFGCLINAMPLGGRSGVEMTFLDVGQGDAMLLRGPSGQNVLVDGGIDEATLTAKLRSRRVEYLDAVIVSHSDSDHVGGLTGTLYACGVGLLVHPDIGSDGLMGKLLGLAGEMGVTVRSMRAGDRLELGDVSLTALGPPAQVPADADSNEYSLVLRAMGPGFSLLLPGDVEEEGQRMLAGCADKLDCDILKVPHHGGYSESGDAFFAMISPRIGVISVGDDNPYGHPSEETIASLQACGCTVYRTDQHGDIVIRVAEGGYEVECGR